MSGLRLGQETLKYEILELAKVIGADVTPEDLMYMNTRSSLVEMYMELCHDSNYDPLPEIVALQQRLRKIHHLIEAFEDKFYEG